MVSKGAVALLAVSCTMLPAVAAQASPWTRVGQQYVDFRQDPAVIHADTGQATFRKLRLEVTQHALEIDKVTVFLANNRSFEVTLDTWLAPDRDTRTFKVPGAPAAIRRVEFTYRNGSSSEDPLPLVRLMGES
jgi:hypothetical protein